jgi:polysaccharide pyruvyl transferase WcaK-like protein
MKIMKYVKQLFWYNMPRDQHFCLREIESIVYLSYSNTSLTKKQQDNVIFLISEHLKNMTSRFQYILIQKTIPSTISDLQE